MVVGGLEQDLQWTVALAQNYKYIDLQAVMQVRQRFLSLFLVRRYGWISETSSLLGFCLGSACVLCVLILVLVALLPLI
jgi:hypothetical protein